MLSRPRPPYICTSCLLRRRLLPSQSRSHFSTTTPSFPPPPPARALIPLPRRRLLSLSGPDAPKFLQGLVTQNVNAKPTSGWYSAFLNAQGRVLWDTFIYPFPENDSDLYCLIEIDGRELPALLAHLKRHKLRSKISFRALDEGEIGVWTAWDDTGPLIKVKDMLQMGVDSWTTLQDPRAPGMGSRVLVPRNEPERSQELMDLLSIASEERLGAESKAYDLRRYLRGVAEGPDEIPSTQALPQESNIDFMEGIDFRKGCYVGQELTIRTHHTGVVRKRILPACLYGAGVAVDDGQLDYEPDRSAKLWQSLGGSDTAVPPGTDIRRIEEGKKGRSAGKWIAGIGNVGLALCRLEMMTDVRLTAEGGLYKEGAEFGMKWSTTQIEETSADQEKELRVKVFVPPWMRQKLDERPLKVQR